MGGAIEILLIMNYSDYIFVPPPERTGSLDILLKHPHFVLFWY